MTDIESIPSIYGPEHSSLESKRTAYLWLLVAEKMSKAILFEIWKRPQEQEPTSLVVPRSKTA